MYSGRQDQEKRNRKKNLREHRDSGERKKTKKNNRVTERREQNKEIQNVKYFWQLSSWIRVSINVQPFRKYPEKKQAEFNSDEGGWSYFSYPTDYTLKKKKSIAKGEPNE